MRKSLSDTPVPNEIEMFMHCAACLSELHADDELDESPSSYARFEIGVTKAGLQVWCTRHDLNVAHFEIPRKYFGPVQPTCTSCGE